MLSRVCLGALFSTTFFAGQAVGASPLTYDFTGTFGQPLNGFTQFSGSVTIDGNPMVAPYGAVSTVSERGNDVSLTVNNGGPAGSWAEAGITSIELISTPEPSTFALFAVLAVAGIVCKHRRSPRFPAVQ
jgi:hypothetical protein